MPKHILVAVAWPYVNGDLHVGHLAGYLLPADIFARFHRLVGDTVLMVSGSDCYGTPITLEADKRGVTPRDIVDEYHAKNTALFAQYGFSFDLYTKTATENHTQVVQEMFLALLEHGYIFTDTSLQYYSVSLEKFLPDRYVEGTCPICGFESARSDQCDSCGTVLEQGKLIAPHSKLGGEAVILKETQHYFLDWPKLQPQLAAYVDRIGGQWKSWVREETLRWLEKGLQPRAITRDLDWGVAIPTDRIPSDLQIDGADQKRIYVWFDAVIGYLSASKEWAQGDSWKDWWMNPAAEHSYFMGKDNLVFHTLFWPGQLLGAYGDELHLPDYPSINQFLTLQGQKFSKSRGVTIDSKYLADTYGADAIRFYLCSILPESSDASFSWADFVQKHNSLAIGNVGNFINRSLTLAKGTTLSRDHIDHEIHAKMEQMIGAGYDAYAKRECKHAYEQILQLSSLGNEYINRVEPWKHKGEPVYDEYCSTAIAIVLGLLLLMKPVTPKTVEKLEAMMGITIGQWDYSALLALLSSVQIGAITPAFTKLDESIVALEQAKLPALP